MRRLGIAALVLTVIAAGCGSSGAGSSGGAAGSSGSGGSGSSGGSQSQPSPPPTGGSGGPVVTYQVWLDRGRTLWPVTRTAPQTVAVGRAAMQSLLAGPTGTERRHRIGTAIPAETALRGLVISGGTATVDLTSAYESGSGSPSMTMRLAQVVYTLTQFPTVKRVVFELDGTPVTVFSSEGIALDRPQTRPDYESVLPVIAVATPGFEATVRSPVTVSGLADVFEANVSVEVLDAHGHVLAKGHTLATCGTGCWGAYTLQLDYSISSAQQATVLVHDDDAAGTGTYPHQVRIPVLLTP